jgi:hypothetical protein
VVLGDTRAMPTEVIRYGVLMPGQPTTRPPHIPEDLWEIMTGSADAISHHWVPRMVLRNFTQHPNDDDPEIWCQPVGGGAPRISRIGAECTIRDHNTLVEAELPPRAIEGLYARIEADAAPVVRKLLEGDAFNEAERFAMAYLIAVQHIRTPRARGEHRYVGEQAATLQMITRASAEREPLRDRARQFLTERDGAAPTDEKVEAWIDESVEALESGKLVVRAPHDMDAGLGLLSVNEIVGVIYNMAWTGFRTDTNQLVLGDHPVVIHDPNAGPDQPSAWKSSPDVEVVFPLAPYFCLALGHAKRTATYQQLIIGRPRVEEINLRSVAHAWRHYYGPTQQSVQTARQLAKKHSMRVATLKPVPSGLVIGQRVEGAAEPFRVDVHRAPVDIKVSRPRKA